MSKKGIEVLVGCFVLLGLAGLLFLSLKAANLASFGERNGYMVSARFDNIGGLKPRAPVRSAGVTVGRVKTIGLDPKTFQGVVTMELTRVFSSRGTHRPRSSPPACSVTSSSASSPVETRKTWWRAT